MSSKGSVLHKQGSGEVHHFLTNRVGCVGDAKLQGIPFSTAHNIPQIIRESETTAREWTRMTNQHWMLMLFDLSGSTAFKTDDSMKDITTWDQEQFGKLSNQYVSAASASKNLRRAL